MVEEASVDLTNFRMVTGGDPHIEQHLFTQFIEATRQNLSGLVASQEGMNEQEWRHHAHAIKGAAYNLGANELAELCLRAEKMKADTIQRKQEQLERITHAFEDVGSFLQTEH